MKSKSILKFCTGCGACVSAKKANLQMDEKGFLIPHPCDDSFQDYCNKTCFATGRQYQNIKESVVWGPVLSSYYAWSSNPLVRHQASSGGTLTALCVYLLESKFVDGIVHIKENPDNPISTLTTCSVTINDIITNSGSRYSSSSPLLHINDYLDKGKRYCFVGKPCDVATLRNLMIDDARFRNTFTVLLSFFCAGAPSEKANMTLLQKMGTNIEECRSLRYRGEGWPGFATAIDSSGTKFTLEYRTAWRDTLGRDIRPICRFCIDGIGELADIVCYDAWYMDEQFRPIFDEAKGRNGVMCRTALGNDIFEKAVSKGYIIASDYSSYAEELPYYQRYQFTRRSTLASTFLALKLLGRDIPSYPLRIVLNLMKSKGVKAHYSRFKGTIKRILQGKI